MKNLFQTSSYIQSVRTLVDGGLKLDIITQELTPDEATKLFSLKGKQGWFLFSEAEIRPEDIDLPDEVPAIKGEKTPSQRLRARMFVYFTEHLNRKKEDFYDWYVAQLDKIGQRYLEKME